MDKRKILVIDDEEDFGYIVKTNLEQDGNYTVKLEMRSPQGMSTAIKYKPDLIILDVMMPEKNGFEVLSELKKNSETLSIPVVMLTAVGDEESKVKAMQLYSEYYLEKPVEHEVLKSKIDSILKIRMVDPGKKKEILKQEEEVREEKAADRKDSGKKERAVRNKEEIKILVVDDDKTACDLMMLFLRSRRFQVFTCSESDKAMPLFLEKRPDIVFLDLIMPKIDGMEILHMIKELKTGSRVVILTGVDDPTVLEDTVKLGADDIIVKPYSMNQIEAALIKHLTIMYRGYPR